MADAIYKQIGLHYRAERVAKGFTQSELAEQLGVTFQQVQKYENGSNRIPIDKLIKSLEIFGISMTDFFSHVYGNKVQSLSPDSVKEVAEERQLVNIFRELDPKVRKATLEMIQTVSKQSGLN